MDATDKRILKLLREDARRPLKTIAGAVGLARSTVRDRIARLEAIGVIRGYRADVRADAENSSAAILDVQLTADDEPRLMSMIQTMREVRRCYVMAEPGRLLLEVTANGADELYGAGDWIAQQPEVASVRVSAIRKYENSE